jgi:hypothetical protein
LYYREAEPANDVIFRGPIRGSSAVKSEDAIGPAINHTFTVSYRQQKGHRYHKPLFKKASEFVTGQFIASSKVGGTLHEEWYHLSVQSCISIRGNKM